MQKIEGTGVTPCAVCGEYPVLVGGVWQHSARLECPNYKSETVLHGRLCPETKGVPTGFTKWHFDDWWTEEQASARGLPNLVEEWNRMHSRRVGSQC